MLLVLVRSVCERPSQTVKAKQCLSNLAVSFSSGSQGAAEPIARLIHHRISHQEKSKDSSHDPK